MLLQKEQSCLLLVDVQEKLTPYVMRPDMLVDSCAWLMRLAHALEVPILTSEQYSKGLGHTVDSLQSYIDEKQCYQKVAFSSYGEPTFKQAWHKLNKKQALIIGIETHVCVLQTAMDMHAAGVDVFVVVDAVSSRHELDHKYGLKRLKQAGIQLLTREMVFFEWIRKAGTAEFKALSTAFLKNK